MCPQTFLFKLASVDSLCVTGPAEKHSFQAETRQLLDIVAKSLYSEKEVSFLFPSLTLFLTTVINFKFPLQPHKKYYMYITQY